MKCVIKHLMCRYPRVPVLIVYSLLTDVKQTQVCHDQVLLPIGNVNKPRL